MNNHTRFVALSLSICCLAKAAPFLAVGDGAELFATGNVGIRADDNIFLAHNSTSDTVFDVAPGLQLTFGKDANVKGSITVVDDFVSYSSHSSLNTNLFSGDLKTDFDDGKSKLGFLAGYHELNQNTVDLSVAAGGALVRRNESHVNGNGEVQVSDITSIAVGADYLNTKYKRTGYGNQDVLGVPVDFYYKYTPKTDFSIGYQYVDTKVKIGSDSTDNFFNVGVRGELAPLLTGQVRVGYTQRKTSASTQNSVFTPGRTRSTPGLDATLTYAYSPKTSISVSSSNVYNANPTGPQQKNFTLGSQVNSALTPEWTATAGATYRNIAYSSYTQLPSHTDDYWEGLLGAGYTVNTYLKINGTYTYRKNTSDVTSNAFTDNVFSLSAAVRY